VTMESHSLIDVRDGALELVPRLLPAPVWLFCGSGCWLLMAADGSRWLLVAPDGCSGILFTSTSLGSSLPSLGHGSPCSRVIGWSRDK
jgi:hypothetical protein